MAYPLKIEEINVRVSTTSNEAVIETLANEIKRLTAELNLTKHTEQHLRSAEAQLVKQEKEITLLKEELNSEKLQSSYWKGSAQLKELLVEEFRKQIQIDEERIKKLTKSYNYWKVSSEINYKHMCELIDDNNHLKDSYDELLTKYLGTLK